MSHQQVERITTYLTHIKRDQKYYASLLLTAILFYGTCKYLSGAIIARSSAAKDVEEIPMPEGCYPIVGHMLSLGNSPGLKIKEWHRKYGPIIRLKMGIQTWILVDDPQLSQKIFVSHGIDTSYRPYSTFGYKHYGKNGKGIAFSNPGSVWQKSRSAALLILAPKQIQKYASFMRQEAVHLAHRLIQETLSNGGDGVAPLKHLELCAMNTILCIAFGKRRFESVEEREFKEVSVVVETIMEMAATVNDFSSFVPSLSFIDAIFGSEAKMRKFIQTQRDPVLKKLIKNAQENKESNGENFVKTLDESDFNLEEDELLVLMSDLISGGTDTTTVTLLWTFALMCHHPEAQEKVMEEIDTFIEAYHHLPSFEERSKIPYCISVMKECMRYKPTSPFGAPHSVRKKMIIENYVFPKDCYIFSSMESLHTNPACYADPDTFVPDRFMNNQKTMQSAANGKLEERDHYNFGWGRRICPGIALAEVEIFNAFVQVLARCKIERACTGLPNINEAKPAALTICPLPYSVKFVKRANSLVVE